MGKHLSRALKLQVTELYIVCKIYAQNKSTQNPKCGYHWIEELWMI